MTEGSDVVWTFSECESSEEEMIPNSPESSFLPQSTEQVASKFQQVM